MESAQSDNTHYTTIKEESNVDDKCMNYQSTVAVLDNKNISYDNKIDQQNGVDSKHVAYARIRTILDQYLECPSLLDGSIRILVDTIVEPILVEILSRRTSSSRRRTSDHEQQQKHDKHQQSSQPCHDETCDDGDATYSNTTLRYGLSVLYLLSKVRGRKCIATFLPHNVDHIEPVWMILQDWIISDSNINRLSTEDSISNKQHQQNEQHHQPPPIWQSVYVLWMWMALLSLVPFDVKKIIHHSNNNDMEIYDKDNNHSSSIVDQNSFMYRLVHFCQDNLNDPGPNRDVVASCLAHWLARPDPNQEQYIMIFVQWSLSTIASSSSSSPSDRNQGKSSIIKKSTSTIFVTLGILQTCTTVIKVSSINRTQLLSYLEPLWDPLLLLSDSVYDILVIQKLLVKWWTRMCTLYLPPRIANWRYQRGTRSLHVSLPNNVPPTNKIIQQQQQQPDNSLTDAIATTTDDWYDSDDLLIAVPDVVEDAVGLIINSLSHSSTIVRWAAAKGIGRITERLPKICADDILDAILELFYDEYHPTIGRGRNVTSTGNSSKLTNASTSDQCWHGGCLALAELARRGLLLPHRLPDVVPFIIRAVQYDVQRGGTQTNGSTSSSVGSHVRDAGCYTYWAFARAYDAITLRPYIRELSEAVLLTSLFDREVNCRRAASAAFQESVGRQGATNFPNGIDIITTADYFSLGNRSGSYLQIAPKIASLDHDMYTKPILTHIFTVKLFHWDETIRILASKSLHNITSLSISYVGTYILPILLVNCLDEKNLNIRHGALLGVAEIIYALAKLQRTDVITQQNRDSLINLVTNIEKKRLYRGRGGESMRSAVCWYIECLCTVQFPLVVKDQVMLLDSVDANLPHPKEDVQMQACLALRALLTTYFPVREQGPTERLQGRVVDKFIQHMLSSDNPAIVRGYTMALGYLPVKLLAPRIRVLESIVTSLAKTSRYDNVIGGEGDAESRRNSLQSLLKILETVGFIGSPTVDRMETSYPRVYIDRTIYLKLFDTFFCALEDYRSDRRGDVGSWCRIQGINGLTMMILGMNSVTFIEPNERQAYATKTVAVLLKQLVEKLDTVRVCAGTSLVQLLLHPESCKWILYHQQLVENFGVGNEEVMNDDYNIDKHNDIPTIKWDNIAWVFTHVTAIASLNESMYFENIVLGLILSIGGLTESVSTAAQSSLVQWAKTATMDQLASLGCFMVMLLEKHRGNERYTFSILKAINKLLVHQGLDRLIQSMDHSFCTECLRNVLLEEKVCHRKDVKHLFAIVDIICSLVSASPASSSEHKDGLAFLCWMLSHPFPRVRSYTAEQFYITIVSLSSGTDYFENQSATEQILINTPWASEDFFDPIQTSRTLSIHLSVTNEFQKFC